MSEYSDGLGPEFEPEILPAALGEYVAHNTRESPAELRRDLTAMTGDAALVRRTERYLNAHPGELQTLSRVLMQNEINRGKNIDAKRAVREARTKLGRDAVLASGALGSMYLLAKSGDSPTKFVQALTEFVRAVRQSGGGGQPGSER
jgi:hypothetical protein